MMKILIKQVKIIDPSQNFDFIGDILIDNNIFIETNPSIKNIDSNTKVIDGKNFIATPGFVDIHSHLREPGFENKETIETGSQAAIKGGFTTICSMPNTEPIQDDPDIIKNTLKIKNSSNIDIHPIAAVSKKQEGKQIVDMKSLKNAGAVLFSDDGNPVQNDEIMPEALKNSKELDLRISNHCENLDISSNGVMHQGHLSWKLGLTGISTEEETTMLKRDLEFAKKTKGKLHVAHVSCAKSVQLIKKAKKDGIDVTAEVSPHHLVLDEEIILGNNRINQSLNEFAYNTFAKVYPPIRSKEDRIALVEGLKTHIIDCIATDHAPHEIESKQTTFNEASRGIAVFETALGSLFKLVLSNEISLYRIIEALTISPARVIGKKFKSYGTLSNGTSADLVLINPSHEWIVNPDKFLSKGKNTPFNNMSLKGIIEKTIVKGNIVYERGKNKNVR